MRELSTTEVSAVAGGGLGDDIVEWVEGLWDKFTSWVSSSGAGFGCVVLQGTPCEALRDQLLYDLEMKAWTICEAETPNECGPMPTPPKP